MHRKMLPFRQPARGAAARAVSFYFSCLPGREHITYGPTQVILCYNGLQSKEKVRHVKKSAGKLRICDFYPEKSCAGCCEHRGSFMKKTILFLLSCVLIMNGCAAPQGGSGSGDAGKTGAGSTAAEAGQAAEEREEDAGGPGEKPALVVMDEEEDNFDRAVKNRSAKSKADPDAYMIRGRAEAGENGAGSADGRDSGNTQSDGGSKEYTVMVYIVGSNLESRVGAATSDIEEMEDAGLNYDKANLLLYTGGSRRWVSDIPNDTNNVLDLSREEGNRIIAGTSESANMGSPRTLAEFVNYCTRNYPAEHYALILWDHGGGPLWGYGSDELFGNDSLILGELRTAMSNTIFGPDKKLDWVGFDACLMGSLENAVLWKDYAQYLISSEEVEAGRGWDYHFLSVFNDSPDAEVSARAVVDAYGSYYEQNRSEFFAPDATLSVMDLSGTDEVVTAVNDLFDSVNKGVLSGEYAKINQARSRTKAFGLGAVESIEAAYDLVDLKDFTGQLEELYPSECGAVADAVDQMVIHSTSNVEGTGGVSIYIPGSNKSLFNVSEELSAEAVPISPGYNSFVDSFTGEWLSESETVWNLAAPSVGSGELTLQLTEEQSQNVSQAYYAILWRNSFGEYTRALTDVPIEADEEGILHIPADPMLVTTTSDLQENELPWTCRQIAAKNGTGTYSTVKTYISAANDFTDFQPILDEEVEIVFKNKDGESDTTVKDVVSLSGGAWSSGKESIDVTSYSTILDMGSFGHTPKRKDNGEMEPFSNWNRGGAYESSPLSVDRSFRFIMRPASSFDLSFICQVVIRDVHNGIHASGYVELPVSKEREIVEEKTAGGVLRYEIFDDHAELYDYEGSDAEIEIAAVVSGKPVTVIGDGALWSNFDKAYNDEPHVETVKLPDSITEIGWKAFPYIEQINLPDGLRVIGERALSCCGAEELTIPDTVEIIGSAAFENSKLRKVQLPSSVRRIGPMPFVYCSQLEEILIGEENGNYKTVDGVLYTKDGLKLIQYPGGKGERYSVEEGTETIGYGAFAQSSVDYLFNEKEPLKHVTLPDTLRTIENAAFFGCEYLESIELPESLEEIGAAAFGKTFYFSAPEEQAGLIRIGPAVQKIGEWAFIGVGAQSFEVDENNEHYASLGGFITNKAGDTILAAPRWTEETLEIPEGITTLPANVFAYLAVTDYYIPDSVFRFATDTFGDNAQVFTIHCTEGSAAKAYAEKYGIDYEIVGEEGVSEAAANAAYSTERETKDDCTFSWRVFGDHAELVEMETKGTVGLFEVPAEHKGLPVTALGYEDDSAGELGAAYVKKIVIPESVRAVNVNFLDNMYGLAEIETAENNPALRSEDNVLFTRDGTLVFYSREKADKEYAVPDGTKEIGKKAFSLCRDLEKVTMPDTVYTIGESAFGSCTALSSATLGEGVENIDNGAFESCYALKEAGFSGKLRFIGDYAFSSTQLRDVKLPSTVEAIGSSAFTVGEGFGEITLPESLIDLGFRAFETDSYAEVPYQARQETLKIPADLSFEPDMLHGILIMNFEVDDNNPYHSVVDGLLMSSDGKILVCVPGAREGALTVPEGTESIEYDAFNDCPYLTDVYLPDSVTDIGNLGEGGYDAPCPYKVHCHAGSEAQKQLEANSVEWEDM